MLYPLRLKPIFKQYLWGGRRLETLLGKQLGEGEHFAESWEVVDHGQDQSVVINGGPLRGKTLGEICATWPEALLGKYASCMRFPLLYKFLDAHLNLSVQVHPDDQAASRLDPPDQGKTEAWIVLAAEPGSRIYAGLKQGCSRQIFEQALAEGRILEWLHCFEPKVGDCVFLPAGTVHALGAGLLVAEIQQSSDTTFRLYDWDRLGPDGKPRPLHIAQALEVIDFQRGPIDPVRSSPADQPGQTLIRCPYFTVDRYQLASGDKCSWGGDNRFHILSVLDGQLEASHRFLERPVVCSETILLPAACTLGTHATKDTTVLDIYIE